MQKKDIDSIAYLIKKAKEKGLPKPIVFLGAGASVSAGIPGSFDIMKDILEEFKDKPEIKKLDSTSLDYYNVMGCLNTDERHQLLRNYINNDKVKINVTNIYLAQMLKEGLIDYVLTVNFDDLLLRACALFNFLPPVYDIAILKDFTTTTLIEKSVTYLHGQHHGFWLLNTGDELGKVKEYIPTVLDRICNNRTWIIVGYSGQDTIFDQISQLKHFTNDLYWIGYNDNEPEEKVKVKLLDQPNSNAYWVSGYDSDAFFLKLHSELGMDTPDIFNKPFSFLKGLMSNIKDIDETSAREDHQTLFKNVKERYEVSSRQVEAAIKQYEKNDPSGALSGKDIKRDQFKKEIIEATVKKQFNKASELLGKADLKDKEITELLHGLFFEWGNQIANLQQEMQNEKSYRAAIQKYEKAIELNPKSAKAYNNLGNRLNDMGVFLKNPELIREALEKYQKAIDINPKMSFPYDNYGSSLVQLAEIINDSSRLEEAIKMFKKAIGINPTNGRTYNNWASAITLLSKMNLEVNSEQYDQNINQAIEKANRAIELGDISYNLACAYALLNIKDKALKTLEISLQKKEIGLGFVLADVDWNKYLDDPDFKVLSEKYIKRER